MRVHRRPAGDLRGAGAGCGPACSTAVSWAVLSPARRALQGATAWSSP